MSMDSQTIETLLTRALNEVDASRYTRMSISFLRQSRMDGIREGRTPGPPFVKIGRAVRYLRDDLDTWLESYRQEPRHGDES
jgi:hypothetical protein